jgi:hypothetical protein
MNIQTLMQHFCLLGWSITFTIRILANVLHVVAGNNQWAPKLTVVWLAAFNKANQVYSNTWPSFFVLFNSVNSFQVLRQWSTDTTDLCIWLIIFIIRRYLQWHLVKWFGEARSGNPLFVLYKQPLNIGTMVPPLQRNYCLTAEVNHNFMLSYVLVTIDGVWIGEYINCPLTGRDYK